MSEQYEEMDYLAGARMDGVYRDEYIAQRGAEGALLRLSSGALGGFSGMAGVAAAGVLVVLGAALPVAALAIVAAAPLFIGLKARQEYLRTDMERYVQAAHDSGEVSGWALAEQLGVVANAGPSPGVQNVPTLKGDFIGPRRTETNPALDPSAGRYKVTNTNTNSDLRDRPAHHNVNTTYVAPHVNRNTNVDVNTNSTIRDTPTYEPLPGSSHNVNVFLPEGEHERRGGNVNTPVKPAKPGF